MIVTVAKAAPIEHPIHSDAINWEGKLQKPAVVWHYDSEGAAWYPMPPKLRWDKERSEWVEKVFGEIYFFGGETSLQKFGEDQGGSPQQYGLSRIHVTLDGHDFEVKKLFGLMGNKPMFSLVQEEPPVVSTIARRVNEPVNEAPDLNLDQRLVAKDIQKLISYEFLGQDNTCDVVTRNGQRCGGLPVASQCRYYCKNLLVKKLESLFSAIRDYVYDPDQYDYPDMIIDIDGFNFRLHRTRGKQQAKTLANMILKKRPMPREVRVLLRIQDIKSSRHGRCQYLTRVGAFPAEVRWAWTATVHLVHTMRW